MKHKPNPHRELIEKFCHAQDHGTWMLWTEPTLGANTDVCAKPDVLMISKSWANYEVRIIEIKVQQTDLNKDVKALKFEKYFNWCHRVSFCLGEGLKDDVLKDHPVGIIKLTKGGFHTKKAAPRLQNRTADFTQSFDMFHALNMGGFRFDNRLRVDRVRAAREHLELALHKQDYNNLYRRLGKQLEKKIDELRNLQRKTPEQIEQDLRHELLTQMKTAMQLNGWRTPEDLGQIVKQVFEVCRKEFDDNLERRLDALAIQTGLSKENQ